jgi:hypothetical protein
MSEKTKRNDKDEMGAMEIPDGLTDSNGGRRTGYRNLEDHDG